MTDSVGAVSQNTNIVRGLIKAPVTLTEFDKQFKLTASINDDSWMDEDFMTMGFSFLKNDDPNSVWNKNVFSSVKPSAYYYYDEQGQVTMDNSKAYYDPTKAFGANQNQINANYSAVANPPENLRQYSQIVSEMAKKYNVPENIIYSVMNTESTGNPRAVSPAGAKGLMQLMPPTAKEMGVSDVFDVKQNIEGGVKFLKQMFDKYNNWDLALKAYNAGPGTVDKYLMDTKNNLPAETLGYTRKINSYMDVLS